MAHYNDFRELPNTYKLSNTPSLKLSSRDSCGDHITFTHKLAEYLERGISESIKNYVIDSYCKEAFDALDALVAEKKKSIKEDVRAEVESYTVERVKSVVGLLGSMDSIKDTEQLNVMVRYAYPNSTQ